MKFTDNEIEKLKEYGFIEAIDHDSWYYKTGNMVDFDIYNVGDEVWVFMYNSLDQYRKYIYKNLQNFLKRNKFE
jgi:hypothetical protein